MVENAVRNYQFLHRRNIKYQVNLRPCETHASVRPERPCVTPRNTGKTITKLLNKRWQRGEGREPVEVRASPGGGEERVVRQDMVTLPPMKWIHDSIVNFVGKVLIQPWGGRSAAKVHVFNA